MTIYEGCPVLNSEHFALRLTTKDDCDDLLTVYSDKYALPFFSSDSCHGDNFYYATRERMLEVIAFWETSRYFARLSIVDKATERAIGTVELCYRVSDDAFHDMGILRLDVRSDHENEETLFELFSLIPAPMYELIGCRAVLTRAPIYAVDRIAAIRRAGFTRSPRLLIGGQDGYAYNGYRTIEL